MRCSNRVMAWCFVWAVGFTLAINTGNRAVKPGALPPQAELVFEDRFEKPELDPAWKVKVGQWRIVDGALEASGPDAFLLLNRDAGPSMRLEYTAWSDDPCDLSACLNLDATLEHAECRADRE